VLPLLVLKACENATQLSPEEMEKMIEDGRAYQPLFL
jgi:hypothetical protein